MEERAEREEFRSKVLHDAKQRVTGAFDKTSEAAGRWGQGLVEYGRDNVGTTAVAIFGAGLGIGYWIACGRSTKQQQNMIPAVASAVADALRSVFSSRS